MELEKAEQRESFIVQNITLNYQMVSDIHWEFAPREVKDLTWEDPIIIKRSNDLKKALRSGMLKQLTPEEYEKTLNLQYQREKRELERNIKDKANYKKMQRPDDPDREITAERIDVSKAKRKNPELDLTGTANHPMSYVAAFEAARIINEEQGVLLTPEEFAQMVELRPTIVEDLLAQTKQASVAPKRVIYATPPNGSGSSGVTEGHMVNYNRSFVDANEPDISSKLQYIEEAVEIRDAIDLDNFDDNDSDYQDEDFTETIDLEKEG